RIGAPRHPRARGRAANRSSTRPGDGSPLLGRGDGRAAGWSWTPIPCMVDAGKGATHDGQHRKVLLGTPAAGTSAVVGARPPEPPRSAVRSARLDRPGGVRGGAVGPDGACGG